VQNGNFEQLNPNGLGVPAGALYAKEGGGRVLHPESVASWYNIALVGL